MSHLLQMRGLKHQSKMFAILPTVASFTDAWIETACKRYTQDWRLSHLLQMRGLKHVRNDSENRPLCRIFYRCVD